MAMLRSAAFTVPTPNFGSEESAPQEGRHLWLCPTGVGPGYFVGEDTFQTAQQAKVAYEEKMLLRHKYLSDSAMKDHPNLDPAPIMAIHGYPTQCNTMNLQHFTI